MEGLVRRTDNMHAFVCWLQLLVLAAVQADQCDTLLQAASMDTDVRVDTMQGFTTYGFVSRPVAHVTTPDIPEQSGIAPNDL